MTSIPTVEQQPLVLSGFAWEKYLSIEEFFQNSGVSVRFLEHQIEIKAPVSEEHEHKKSNIGRLVEAFGMEHGIRFFIRGNMTMTQPGEAGGEPDESYCFNEKKEVSDLVIEVALTSGGLSKREFYKKFQVPELWFWRNSKLEVYTYNSNEDEYLPANESTILVGIDLVALAKCAEIEYASDAIIEFRKSFT